MSNDTEDDPNRTLVAPEEFALILDALEGEPRILPGLLAVATKSTA